MNMNTVVSNELDETKVHPRLQAFIDVAPLLSELFPIDFCIGIANKERLLLGVAGETIPALSPDYILTKRDGMYEAVKYNQSQRTILPEEVFGFPVLATAIPVHDENGEVIGAVGVANSLEQYDILYDIALKLSEAVEQVSVTIQELSGSLSTSSESIHTISGQSKEVLQSVNEIEEVAIMVREVSDYSHILGLNASIEASRAGDFGKGFSVVASEIGKMAESSRNHTETIRDTAFKINKLITKLHKSISNTNVETDEQSAATTQLAATMKDISQTASELEEYAGKLVKG